MTAIERGDWHRKLPRLGTVLVKPLSLDDWETYQTFVRRVEQEDMRLRFAGRVNFDDSRWRRLLDIDHIREEAFAAFDQVGTMLGVARLVRVTATDGEIAMIVRSDLKRHGIGNLLLERLIQHGKAIGLAALIGYVLRENQPMLALAQRAGFKLVGNAGLMAPIRLDLAAPTTPAPVATFDH